MLDFYVAFDTPSNSTSTNKNSTRGRTKAKRKQLWDQLPEIILQLELLSWLKVGGILFQSWCHGSQGKNKNIPSLPASSLHLLFTPLPSSGSPSISSPPPFLILSILHHPSLLSSPPSTPTAGPQIDSHGSRLTEDDYTVYEHTHICTHTHVHTHTHTYTHTHVRSIGPWETVDLCC